jgi:hypothetical protein
MNNRSRRVTRLKREENAKLLKTISRFTPDEKNRVLQLLRGCAKAIDDMIEKRDS